MRLQIDVPNPTVSEWEIYLQKHSWSRQYEAEDNGIPLIVYAKFNKKVAIVPPDSVHADLANEQCFSVVMRSDGLKQWELYWDLTDNIMDISQPIPSIHTHSTLREFFEWLERILDLHQFTGRDAGADHEFATKIVRAIRANFFGE